MNCGRSSKSWRRLLHFIQPSHALFRSVLPLEDYSPSKWGSLPASSLESLWFTTPLFSGPDMMRVGLMWIVCYEAAEQRLEDATPWYLARSKLWSIVIHCHPDDGSTISNIVGVDLAEIAPSQAWFDAQISPSAIEAFEDTNNVYLISYVGSIAEYHVYLFRLWCNYEVFQNVSSMYVCTYITYLSNCQAE